MWLSAKLVVVPMCPSCRWKCLGESLIAMYQHLTTCEPPRPSLGKRIDLLEYQDLDQHLPTPVTSAPVSVIQPNPISSNPVVSVTELLLTYTPVTPTFPSPNMLDSVNPSGKEDVCQGLYFEMGFFSPCILLNIYSVLQ